MGIFLVCYGYIKDIVGYGNQILNLFGHCTAWTKDWNGYVLTLELDTVLFIKWLTLQYFSCKSYEEADSS